MTDPHLNLIHTDDVDPFTVEKDELRSTSRRLGRAAGATRTGLVRFDVPGGGRTAPAHVHADEEEIFYVVEGGGVSWQDGVTYEIATGDCLVHRRNAEAHTLIAADSGMSVFAFADNSVLGVNLTYLPHSGMFWAGRHWIPADSPIPFKADLAAGPLPAGEPGEERPSRIVHFSDVEEEREDREGYQGVERNLGRAAGSVTSGLRHVLLAPGQLSCPPHWHTIEEEIFVVLGGGGVALLGDSGSSFPLRAGSVLVRPPGKGEAHALRAGDDGMTYLAYGQRDTGDVAYYPRSGKLLVGGVMFRPQVVDYWDGED